MATSMTEWSGWIAPGSTSLRPLVVNEACHGFIVPPGPHIVRVTYFPWSFWGGAIVVIAVVRARGRQDANQARFRRMNQSVYGAEPRTGNGELGTGNWELARRP